MPTYLITYDIRPPGQNYDKIYEYIKAHPYAHVGTSTWLIDSIKSVNQISDDIGRITDGNDAYYVFTINGLYAGRGPQAVNNWIAARFG